MNRSLNMLLIWLDHTLHPQVKRTGGIPLLRARALSLVCILVLPTGFGLLLTLMTNGILGIYVLGVSTLVVMALLVLLLNRKTEQVSMLGALTLSYMGICGVLMITFEGRSLMAPGFLWFPALMMVSIFLCGRRLGGIVSLLLTALAVTTVLYSRRFGSQLPFHDQAQATLRAMTVTVIMIHILALMFVTAYVYLLQDGEIKNQEWQQEAQKTARMQELLQLSGHFALQTQGPLDVLGTALHNLEEPLERPRHPQTVLPLLEPVESCIRDMAAIARSFSLFTRRQLEEGFEQTSINSILQHVDTIYNVGTTVRSARLQWQKLETDMAVHTQTAKLVMLLVSLVRRITAGGGRQLSVACEGTLPNLVLRIKYNQAPMKHAIQDRASGRAELESEGAWRDELVRELCSELGITSSHAVQGEQCQHSLKLPAA